MWTRFMDMHSGGGTKEDFEYLYVEAPEDEARIIFYNRFGHNADRVSCTCCGSDYSVQSGDDLAQLTGFDRNCEFEDKKYVEKPRVSKWMTFEVQSLEDYLARDDVRVIKADEIASHERKGTVPEEGYVWL